MQRRAFLAGILAVGGASALPTPVLAVAPQPTMRLLSDLVWERHWWCNFRLRFVSEHEDLSREKLWYNGIVWC